MGLAPSPTGSPGAASRPAAAMSCLIASSPRTGSWLLAEALTATGVAGRPREGPQPDQYERYKRSRGRPVPFDEFMTNLVAAGTTDNGVYSIALKWNGFRWLLAHERSRQADFGSSDLEVVEALFPNPCWVHLYRLDTARQAISWYRASEAEVWHRQHRRPNPGELPDGFRPNFARIRWIEDLAMAHNRRWREHFANSGITPLDVSYEELDTDLASVVDRVLDYLGVSAAADYANYQPRLLRQSDARSERWLETYLSRRDRLPPSPWAQPEPA